MERVNGFFEFDSELVDYELVILDREDNGEEVIYELEVSFNGFTFEMEYSPDDDCCYYCGNVFDDFEDTEGYKEEEAFFYSGFNYITLKNDNLSDYEKSEAWNMLDCLIDNVRFENI